MSSPLANADWIDETYAAFSFALVVVVVVVVRASEVSLLFSFFDGGNGLFVIDFKFGRTFKSGDARVFDDAFFFTFAFCGDFNDANFDFFCGVFFPSASFFLFGRPKVWPEKVSYRLLTKSIFEF